MWPANNSVVIINESERRRATPSISVWKLSVLTLSPVLACYFFNRIPPPSRLSIKSDIDVAGRLLLMQGLFFPCRSSNQISALRTMLMSSLPKSSWSAHLSFLFLISVVLWVPAAFSFQRSGSLMLFFRGSDTHLNFQHELWFSFRPDAWSVCKTYLAKHLLAYWYFEIGHVHWQAKNLASIQPDILFYWT